MALIPEARQGRWEVWGSAHFNILDMREPSDAFLEAARDVQGLEFITRLTRKQFATFCREKFWYSTADDQSVLHQTL